MLADRQKVLMTDAELKSAREAITENSLSALHAAVSKHNLQKVDVKTEDTSKKTGGELVVRTLLDLAVKHRSHLAIYYLVNKANLPLDRANFDGLLCGNLALDADDRDTIVLLLSLGHPLQFRTDQLRQTNLTKAFAAYAMLEDQDKRHQPPAVVRHVNACFGAEYASEPAQALQTALVSLSEIARQGSTSAELKNFLNIFIDAKMLRLAFQSEAALVLSPTLQPRLKHLLSSTTATVQEEYYGFACRDFQADQTKATSDALVT